MDVLSRGAAEQGSASSDGRLCLEATALLIRLQGCGDLPQLAFEDLVEVVDGQLDAVVGDAALAVVVGADLLGAIARADLGGAVGSQLGLLFGQSSLIQPGPQDT